MKNFTATLLWPVNFMPFRQKTVFLLFFLLPMLASAQSQQNVWAESKMDSLYQESEVRKAAYPLIATCVLKNLNLHQIIRELAMSESEVEVVAVK